MDLRRELEKAIELADKTIEFDLKQQEIIIEKLKRLGLKPMLVEFLRALLKVSKGQQFFEVSRLTLAGQIFPPYEKSRIKQLKENISYRFQQLNKWQKENGIEIIRVNKSGTRTQNSASGMFENTDPEYEFVLLGELIKAVKTNPEKTFEDNLEQALATSRKGTKSKAFKKAKVVKPLQQSYRNRNTIVTLFKQNWKLEERNGGDPVKRSLDIINILIAEFIKSGEKRLEEENLRQIVADFEKRLAKNKDLENIYPYFSKKDLTSHRSSEVKASNKNKTDLQSIQLKSLRDKSLREYLFLVNNQAEFYIPNHYQCWGMLNFIYIYNRGTKEMN